LLQQDSEMAENIWNLQILYTHTYTQQQFPPPKIVVICELIDVFGAPAVLLKQARFFYPPT